MAVSTRHVLHQGPVLGALGRAGLMALKQKLGSAPAAGAPELPGPEVVRTIEARDAQLVRDYVRHVGGDPSAYKRTVPAHLFPQWGFGLAMQTLEGLSYPLMRVMNGGCAMKINAPLPAGKPLRVSARLQSIDDDGRRAVLQQRIVTGTDEEPEALVSDLFAFVPLSSKKKSNGKSEKKAPPRVPEDARELAFWKIGAKAGLDFAKLTGDFNPVHWVPGYARAFGFRNVILHGFGTMARAIEGLNRGLFAGDVNAITEWECRFTKPLVLPARVGLYVAGSDVFVGDAPGGPAYMTGTFRTNR